MANRKAPNEKVGDDVPVAMIETALIELTGHNSEARGREEINRLLRTGWLLHIYTLKYEEDGVWRERPMGREIETLPATRFRRD